MSFYRKKPVEIEAVHLPDDPLATDAEWNIAIDFVRCQAERWWINNDHGITIGTLEGDMTALPGDWIIRGIKGELYPVKPDVFDLTYEAVEKFIVDENGNKGWVVP